MGANDGKVFYCKECLSLRIMGIPGVAGYDFCDECNSTDVGSCSIGMWESMYEERYGDKYLNKKSKRK